MGPFNPTGVCHQLVWNVRRALDEAGFRRTDQTNQIAVSGGFNAAKIAEFERLGVPADIYGVGSSLIKGDFDFTADGVLLDGSPCGKVGRAYRPNPRLEAE
jgi:nicotinate phosphoribosyltransferase